MDKLFIPMKKKPEILGLSRRLLVVVKGIITTDVKLIDDGSHELKIPLAIYNLTIEIVGAYNSLHLITEFKEDLVPFLETLNKHFNQSFDGYVFKIFICFYLRLFRERSHNFRNIRKLNFLFFSLNYGLICFFLAHIWHKHVEDIMMKLNLLVECGFDFDVSDESLLHCFNLLK